MKHLTTTATLAPAAGGRPAAKGKRMIRNLFMISALCLLPALPAAPSPEPIVWATGEVDETGPPAGLLLSDNEGYWGETMLTGVTYHYESLTDNPQDRIANQEGTFGRRLLDGRIGGNWHVPVGQSRGPLVVVFDFQRPCTFSEVNTIATRTPLTAVRVEVADEPEGAWREVYYQPLEDAVEQRLKRLRLPPESRGRYMRLAIESAGITYLDEVIVWGWGEVTAEYPERLAPAWRNNLPAGMFESLPAMKATRFDPDQFTAWRESIGAQADAPAVWAPADEPSPTAPVLPEADAIAATTRLVVARNETESVYLTLTNTTAENLTLTVNEIVLQQDGQRDPRLRAAMLVGGALPAVPPRQRLTREQTLRLMIDDDMPVEDETSDEVRILPFFEPGQRLGYSLMARYLTNGAEIRDYPHLTLPSGGSAVFMLRVTTDHAPAGRYTGEVGATTESGVTVSRPLIVDVADIELPELDLWIRSWGNGTRQFPFESRTRLENDARVNRELGVTVWPGFPEPGSKAEAFGGFGRTYYRLQGIPGHYVHAGFTNRLKPEGITDEDENRVIVHVQDLVNRARELGLDYDEWWVELWDEPQESNVGTFAALARIIRQTDPNVRIYMNPLFWRPGHAPPEDVVKHLYPWYNELVDVSVPISTLVGDGTVSTEQLWSQPRFVRALFMHPASRAGRGMAWRAFELDYNGWGYYCYYAPRGNPWDIRTWHELNFAYQMVFPGPDGPILMPIYETMRKGWQDYQLLAALRNLGEEALIDDLLAGYRDKVPLSKLRLRALESRLPAALRKPD